MSRSNWRDHTPLIICGLIAAFAIGGAVLSTLRQSDQARSQYDYTASQRAEQRLLAVLKECTAAEQRPGDETKDHEQRDLCAQYRAAVAAETSAVYAGSGYWLSLAGLTAILVTLGFTAAQVRAAVTGNKITKITSEKASRAYVAFTGLEDEQITTDGPVYLRPKWKNTGPTPTRHLATNGGYLVTADKVLPDDFAYADSHASNPRFSLGGGVEQQVNGPIISQEELGEVLRGKRLYVWGWVEYNDVFPDSERHRTEFCVLWVLRPGGNRSVIVHGRHNGTDEECRGPLKTKK